MTKDEETEAQRETVTKLRSHGYKQERLNSRYCALPPW
jgi:hypothetical protein